MAKKGNSGAKNLIPIKKGEIRNPKGAPKLEDRPWRPLSEDLKQLLGELTNVTTKTVDGRTLVQEKTFREVIIKKLVAKAATGDSKSIEMIFDRTEGKATQTIAGEAGEPIQITVKYD